MRYTYMPVSILEFAESGVTEGGGEHGVWRMVSVRITLGCVLCRSWGLVYALNSHKGGLLGGWRERLRRPTMPGHSVLGVKNQKRE